MWHPRPDSLRLILSCVLLPTGLGALADGQDTADRPLNTDPNVKYVGSEACVECHQDQHESYLKTTHSVATTKTDPKNEPESATFEHPILGFKYHVERDGDRLVHREVIPGTDGKTLVETKHPIAYSIGSGVHAKSYLFRVGKFFGQSPLTWYKEPNAWRMSPGYEGPFQPSFQRKVESECVFCHVGSIDPLDHNPYLFEIVETTIGCERCHGPGELHATKYRENPNATGHDDTIVNPDSLSRELSEAVCQQCHLQGASWVSRRGKEIWDFRPGLPITDFRVDYQFAEGQAMRIVGHVEQMHASECYKQTETLTCVTCHDPHDPVNGKKQRIDFYRKVCLDCHQEESCGKPHQQRMELAGNNCYQCHMPKADTNVTHAAFHHHRIGIHHEEKPVTSEKAVAAKKSEAKLLPVLDLAGLSRSEKTRCLSIAKVLRLREDPTNPDYNHFGFEAIESLIKLKNAGKSDPVSDCQLALLAIAQNQQEVSLNLAQQAIRSDPRPTLATIEATALLAKMARQSGQYDRAAEYYRKAATYHRDANDTFYLGICEMQLGNIDAAITALKAAIDIDPMQINPHRALQSIYQATNRPREAAIHATATQRIMRKLHQLQQKSSAK